MCTRDSVAAVGYFGPAHDNVLCGRQNPFRPKPNLLSVPRLYVQLTIALSLTRLRWSVRSAPRCHVLVTATPRDAERSQPRPALLADDMAPAPTPTETEMPADMPVALPGDPVPPSDMSFSFSYSSDMDDDMGDDGGSSLPLF